MSVFFKILLFFFIAYFILSWIRKLFIPNPPKRESQKDVRIFKNKEVEKSKIDIHDAETVDFEEIKDSVKKEM